MSTKYMPRTSFKIPVKEIDLGIVPMQNSKLIMSKPKSHLRHLKSQCKVIDGRSSTPVIHDYCDAANCFEKPSINLIVPINSKEHILLSLCEKCRYKFNVTETKG